MESDHKTVFYIEENDDLRVKNTIRLENSGSDVDVVELLSGKKALKVLKDMPEIQYVFIGVQLFSDAEGFFLKKFKEANTPKLIVLNSDPDLSESCQLLSTDYPHINFIELNQSDSEITTKIQSLTQWETSDLESSVQYSKIKLHYFLRHTQTLADIFIRINEEKYVKLINKDQLYSHTIINKYRIKGVEYLYILTSDLSEFSSEISETPFLKKLDKNLPLNASI
mgnify:CR=1 FL=1|jgi:hypothetical protein